MTASERLSLKAINLSFSETVSGSFFPIMSGFHIPKTVSVRF
jgi:hypothetical protein